MLLSNAALAKLITDADKKLGLQQIETQRCQKERAVEKAAADSVCKAKVAEYKVREQACLDNKKQRTLIFESALKKANASPPWYKSPVLSFVLGAVVSGGACVAGAVMKR